MKKASRLISIVFAIGLLSVMLVSCSKTPSNSANFKKIAESKEYTVDDAIDQFSNTPHFKEALIAHPADQSFQIEFYVTDNTDSARSMYSNLESTFDSQKGNIYSGSSVNGKNYAKRTLTSNGKYTMVEYVENTLVFVPQTDSSNKSAIEAFLKELNY